MKVYALKQLFIFLFVVGCSTTPNRRFVKSKPIESSKEKKLPSASGSGLNTEKSINSGSLLLPKTSAVSTSETVDAAEFTDVKEIFTLASKHLNPDKPEQSIKDLNNFWSKYIDSVVPDFHTDNKFANLLVRYQIIVLVGNQVWERVGEQVLTQLDIQARLRLRDQIERQIAIQCGVLLWDLIWDQISAEIKAQNNYAVGVHVRDKIMGPVWMQLSDLINSSLSKINFPSASKQGKLDKSVELVTHFSFIVYQLSFFFQAANKGLDFKVIKNILTGIDGNSVFNKIGIPSNLTEADTVSYQQVNKFLELLRI